VVVTGDREGLAAAVAAEAAELAEILAVQRREDLAAAELARALAGDAELAAELAVANRAQALALAAALGQPPPPDYDALREAAIAAGVDPDDVEDGLWWA
jgi:hypothetical protein